LFSFIDLLKSFKVDGQSSLNSQLMTTLHRQLGIRSEFSTPYHHEGVGLAERYNRTLGNMIKASVQTAKRDWDLLLPYLEEAPATLVRGRGLIGPLGLLRPVWAQGEPQEVKLKKPVLQFLTELLQKLQVVNNAAQQHAEQQQLQQKERYDKQSTECQLTVGSSVQFFCSHQRPVTRFLRRGQVHTVLSRDC
jgi:hypothetical protein